MNSEPTPENITIQIQLSEPALEAIQEIAEFHDCDPGKALEYALGSELFILREQQQGNRIMVGKERRWPQTGLKLLRELIVEE